MALTITSLIFRLQRLSDPQGRVPVDVEVGNEKLTSNAVIVGKTMTDSSKERGTHRRDGIIMQGIMKSQTNTYQKTWWDSEREERWTATLCQTVFNLS